jgi:cytochrome c-type biogenesis protein CcmH
MSAPPQRPRPLRTGPARRLLTLLMIACAVLGVSAGTAAAESRSDAKAANTFTSIESQFMCVACHEPLELVSSPEALSEKATLLGFVKKGMTLPQIKRAMVAQYSEQVLAVPPASGFNLMVYVLPPVVVIIGILLLIYTLPKWRRRSRQAAATKLQGSQPLDPDEASRLDSELDQFI